MDILTAFVLGFAVGVFERKVDRLRVNKATVRSTVRVALGKPEPKSEVLETPSPEEIKREEDAEFYARL